MEPCLHICEGGTERVKRNLVIADCKTSLELVVKLAESTHTPSTTLTYCPFISLSKASIFPLKVSPNPNWKRLDPLILFHPRGKERGLHQISSVTEQHSNIHRVIPWQQILLTFREKHEDDTWMPGTFRKSHSAQFNLKYLQVKNNLVLSTQTDNTITINILNHLPKEETLQRNQQWGGKEDQGEEIQQLKEREFSWESNLYF